jgi:glutamyl-Q tRNA(Asp) synthetase
MGSLVTAVASYCHARSQQQKWLLRIEDLDTPRLVSGSADNIIRSLEVFGFEWDGEILYQSQRFDVYEEVIQQLIRESMVYACGCSRKQLKSEPHRTGPLGLIYPGHCRSKNLTPANSSLRLNVSLAGTQNFIDKHSGPYRLNVSRDVGDLVVKRIDGIYAYHLAVVLDDAYQGVNEIVRGADLLEVTAVHLYLNQILNLPSARYLHIPLIRNPGGEKLSKQTGATALDTSNASAQLVQALQFLGQQLPDEISHSIPGQILQHAVSIWDSKKIPQAAPNAE